MWNSVIGKIRYTLCGGESNSGCSQLKVSLSGLLEPWGKPFDLTCFCQLSHRLVPVLALKLPVHSSSDCPPPPQIPLGVELLFSKFRASAVLRGLSNFFKNGFVLEQQSLCYTEPMKDTVDVFKLIVNRHCFLNSLFLSSLKVGYFYLKVCYCLASILLLNYTHLNYTRSICICFDCRDRKIMNMCRVVIAKQVLSLVLRSTSHLLKF